MLLRGQCHYRFALNSIFFTLLTLQRASAAAPGTDVQRRRRAGGQDKAGSVLAILYLSVFALSR